VKIATLKTGLQPVLKRRNNPLTRAGKIDGSGNAINADDQTPRRINNQGISIMLKLPGDQRAAGKFQAYAVVIE
jgi:hypothetical protein